MASAPYPRPDAADSCTVKNYGWTFIAGLCLMIVAQLPSMSRAESVTLMTTCFLVCYSIMAVVLAGTEGGGWLCGGFGRGGGDRRSRSQVASSSAW